MLEGVDLTALIQLSFAAGMCLMIWKAYETITQRVIDVIEHNSAALQNVSTSVGENTRVSERLASAMTDLERRMAMLEGGFPLRRQSDYGGRRGPALTESCDPG